MPSYDSALWALRSWLDSWPRVGHVAVGMDRQGYDLQLTEYDERGLVGDLLCDGMDHSPTGVTGSAFEPTPWRAAQRAAWWVLRSGVLAAQAATQLPGTRNGRAEQD